MSGGDKQCTLYLNECDITIIRFENKLIFDKTDWVVHEIMKNFKESVKSET